MKYALVNRKKVEAIKGTKGFCPLCGSEVAAYCGEVYANHWKHRGNRNCDNWWEPETKWHISWKDKFPKDWQEVIHEDENTGEKHIADVKTNGDWVLEFQHSLIKPEERRSRNAFYPKLVWVINGLRRERDITQFQNALDESTLVDKEHGIRQILFPEVCKLIKEWSGSKSLVFFDFHGLEATIQSQIWFLFPKISATGIYIAPFSWAKFIEMHNENKFDDFFNNVINPYCAELAKYEQQKRQNIQRRAIISRQPRRIAPRHRSRRL